MGQHLQIYASKNITVEEANEWGKISADYYGDSSHAYEKVCQENRRVLRTGDYLDHWSNWCGNQIWFRICYVGHICDQALVDQCVQDAKDYDVKNPYLRERYPDHDFTEDDAIKFLRSHIGYVVWADPDY